MFRIILFVVLLFIVTTKSKEQCDSKESTTCKGGVQETDFFAKDENVWLGKIKEALDQYVPCRKNKSNSCFTDVIANDLEPFKPSGITENMIANASKHGTRYQIIDSKLYRQESCMFPARCSGIEYFLKASLKSLPNMELVVNCRDWPKIEKSYSNVLPVFSFSKTNSYLDIMYPAWSFWEGGPAISLHPTGIGRWDKLRQSITKAAKEWHWEKKINKALFRGSRTSDERDSIVLLSRTQPNLVDAQYTKNQAWKSKADTLNAEPAREISFEAHCKWKYLFNFRGVAASFRFKHLFLCKSLVFHVGDEWDEFFYKSMKPWVHYVPIKSYPSEQELVSIITFFQKHDDLAKEIAQRGYKHIWDNLGLKDVQFYWDQLLKKYGELFKYDVNLDKSLIPIRL